MKTYANCVVKTAVVFVALVGAAVCAMGAEAATSLVAARGGIEGRAGHCVRQDDPWHNGSAGCDIWNPDGTLFDAGETPEDCDALMKACIAASNGSGAGRADVLTVIEGL